jgi:hypothetical protein
MTDGRQHADVLRTFNDVHGFTGMLEAREIGDPVDYTFAMNERRKRQSLCVCSGKRKFFNHGVYSPRCPHFASVFPFIHALSGQYRSASRISLKTLGISKGRTQTNQKTAENKLLYE